MIHSKTLALTDYVHLEKEVDYLKGFLNGQPVAHEHRYWEYGLAMLTIARYRSIKTVTVAEEGHTLLQPALQGLDKYDFITDDGKADAIVSISQIEHEPDEETYLNSLFASANKLVFLTCDYHASGLPQCPYHLRTYNSKLMLGIQLIGESYGFELIGGESDYHDGGTEVNGYTFASIGIVKR